jgi:hypothetical protein
MGKPRAFRTAAAAAAIAGIAAPAIAADQFDLSCISDKQTKKKVPFVIKVDLATGEWCIGKCEETFKIYSATPTMLVLNETESAREGIAGQRINRVTGEYYFYEERPAPGELYPPAALFGRWSQRGKCTPLPFTGLGAEKAKF